MDSDEDLLNYYVAATAQRIELFTCYSLCWNGSDNASANAELFLFAVNTDYAASVLLGTETVH